MQLAKSEGTCEITYKKLTILFESKTNNIVKL